MTNRACSASPPARRSPQFPSAWCSTATSARSPSSPSRSCPPSRSAFTKPSTWARWWFPTS
ncbi:hypothetical protein B6F60_18615 [Mycobacterium tuberculosis variant bovis]|uniref:Uncharacterized protein n=1 Tax=Mycobacterium bovis TaxID=1765 RepID=A0AB74LKQ8_MYCBI|nr:hypothetical protein BXP25_19910 [Mycobacterium tuberculosis variant bovis]OPF90992.1 hypothetical protein BXP26_20610 [Mycobacterium tuberculosis variant bovis]PHO39575.1 hypothetical protein B6F60_18615 [Mycobacterium tuberculosis variant bovis]PHP02233.1 hypothetical protein B6F65_18475 [Mycobacterium tuberculosis variant bovis]PHP02234.1 hypothetical protein B6F65_18490 [Mycobacterium tuberculosis variant bovis]